METSSPPIKLRSHFQGLQRQQCPRLSVSWTRIPNPQQQGTLSHPNQALPGPVQNLLPLQNSSLHKNPIQQRISTGQAIPLQMPENNSPLASQNQLPKYHLFCKLSKIQTGYKNRKFVPEEYGPHQADGPQVHRRQGPHQAPCRQGAQEACPPARAHQGTAKEETPARGTRAKGDQKVSNMEECTGQGGGDSSLEAALQPGARPVHQSYCIQVKKILKYLHYIVK